MNAFEKAAGIILAACSLYGQPVCRGPVALEQQTKAGAPPGAFAALGNHFAQRREFSCAVQAFRKALALEPQSVEANFNLGLALMQSGAVEASGESFRRTLTLKPDLIPARVALATVLVELNDLPGAEEHFLGALRLDAKNSGALRGIARVLIIQQHFAAAIPYLKQALVQEPGELGHFLALGVAYAESGDGKEAVAILKRGIQLAPRLPAFHFNLGNVYAGQELYPDAAREYTEVLRLDPTNEEARIGLASALVANREYAVAISHVERYKGESGFQKHYLLGLSMRGLGRNAEAEPELEKAVASNPKHYDAQYQLGFVQARNGKLREARQHLEAARDLDPNASDARFQLARVLRDLNEEDKSKAEFEAVQKSKQVSANVTAAGTSGALANEQLMKGNAAKAVELYQEALKLEPGNAKTWYNLSLAYARQRDTAGEQRALEKAVELDPRFGKARNQLGLLQLQQGNLDAAEKQLRAALEAEPQYAEAWNNLGVLLSQRSQADDAEKAFLRAVECDGAYTQARLNRGISLASLGRFAEATAELETVVKQTPNDARAITVLAMATAKSNRWKEAEALFRKVVALQPQSSEAQMNLGIALADQPNLTAALQAFTDAVKLAPQSAMARYNKGRASFDLRDYEQARLELGEAYKIDPKFAPALYLLAVTERQLDKSRESADHARQLIALEPNNAEALYLLGRNLMQLGDKPEALEAWRKAVEADPRNAETLYNLSRALREINPQQAAEYLRRFQEIQQGKQMTDRAETLGNFALSAAAARDWPRAIGQMQEALQACGSCPAKGDIHKNLGLILARSGDNAKAIEELKLAQRLKPADPDITRSLEILITQPTRN